MGVLINSENMLTEVLSRNWWLLLLRGICAIAFGVLSYIWPGISLATLVLLFGGYALVDGVIGCVLAVSGRKEREDWWVLLLWGLMSIAMGAMTFVVPGITALGLVLYIGAWAIATGVMQIVAAVRLRKAIEGEWLLILGGAVSVIFGLLLMAQPGIGALSLLWIIAAYAMFFGILLVVLAFKMRFCCNKRFQSQ